MRRGRVILGLVMLVLGDVWFFQGIGILPGSFMTGSRFWAVTGAVVAIVGMVLLIGTLRRARS